MMGTRTGALDPGAVLYLMEIEKLSLEQVGHVLYHESGLLGVSGISSEPRVLLKAQAAGGEAGARAGAALDLYVRRAVREIGAMATAMGGLDLLVFTAGVGEHAAEIRHRIVQGLRLFGIELDQRANAANAAIISTPGSAVAVAVEPTNEEWVAARAAACPTAIPSPQD
jgi:acetate kinase